MVPILAKQALARKCEFSNARMTGNEVLELLKEINKSGKTVIIVTHDEGIAKMTDRIITISDGRIV